MAKKPKSTGDKSLDCLNLALEAAQYGPVRMQNAIEAYHRYVDSNLEKGLGLNDARPEAMAQVMKDLEQSVATKKMKLEGNLKTLGNYQARLDEAGALKTGNAARNYYDAYRSMMEDVNHLKSARSNLTSEKDIALGNINRMLSTTLDIFSRNWAGIARAPIHLIDIANEVMKPGSTANQAAKDIAASIKKMYDYTASEINLAGVPLPRKVGDELPFYPNAAKLEAMGLARFKELFKDANRVDWVNSANGYFVRANERDAFLEKYYNAVIKDQWSDFPRPFEWAGGRFVRDFNNQTMFKFKSGDAYNEMHSMLMNGDFLQTITRQTEKHAHNIALAKVFGPSTDHNNGVYMKMATDAAKAAKLPGKGMGKLNSLMRRAKNIYDMAQKLNPMDPDGTLGLLSNASSNLLSSAMLHGALFQSIAGDFVTMLANRIHNNEEIIKPTMDYVKAFLNPKTTLKHDMLIMGQGVNDYLQQAYHTTHYNWIAGGGETAARWISDKTMKLNLMNRHFDLMRGADTRARSQSLFNARFTDFNDLRERFVLDNNNITPAEWDKTRKAMTSNAYMAADEVGMFRPMDHFDTLGSELAHKWQLLFRNEAKRSVFDATIEARAIMMGNERPDNWVGVLRKSATQFQTYGLTYLLALSRELTHGTPGQRLSALARFGVMGVIAAAVGQQAKNLWNGQDMEPWNPSFWFRMTMTAVAGPWGSVITGGMRADPASTILKTIAGPYAAFLADGYAATIGSAFQYMDMSDANTKFTMGREGIKLADFFRKYTIPQTFYTSMALQRKVFEPLEEAMDPQAMRNKYRAQEQNAAKRGVPYRPGYQPGGRSLGVPFGGNQ